MKKAKIILTAIAIFAVVGGALAVKAKRQPLRAYVPVTTTFTQSIIGPFTYTTTVNSCIIDPDFFVGLDGILGNTFVTTNTYVTGFSNGFPRTWREVICTTKNTLITIIE